MLLVSEMLIAAVRNGEWVWGLNDPDTPSLLVTALYFVCAILCGLSAKRSTIDSTRRNGKILFFKELTKAILASGLCEWVVLRKGEKIAVTLLVAAVNRDDDARNQ